MQIIILLDLLFKEINPLFLVHKMKILFSVTLRTAQIIQLQRSLNLFKDFMMNINSCQKLFTSMRIIVAVRTRCVHLFGTINVGFSFPLSGPALYPSLVFFTQLRFYYRTCSSSPSFQALFNLEFLKK